MGGFFVGFDSRANKRKRTCKRTCKRRPERKRKPERTLTRSKREGVPASKRKTIKK